MTTILFTDDFASYDLNNPNSPYFSVAVPGYPPPVDGVTSVNAGTLTVDSSVYTLSLPTDLDYHKYLVLTKQTFAAPMSNKWLIFEVEAASNQTNLNTLPASLFAPTGTINGIVDAELDPRPCSGGFNVIDANLNFAFDFVITNKMVYALYERLPYQRTEWGGTGPNYLGFGQLFPLYSRSSPSEIVNLKIAYNYQTKKIRYLVNDRVLLELNQLGKMANSKYSVLKYTTPDQVQSPEVVLRPTAFRVGFANFSFFGETAPSNKFSLSNPALVDLSLNGYLPCADPNGYNDNKTPRALNSILSYAEAGNSTNFGQGNILKLQHLKVYTTTNSPGGNNISMVI